MAVAQVLAPAGREPALGLRGDVDRIKIEVADEGDVLAVGAELGELLAAGLAGQADRRRAVERGVIEVLAVIEQEAAPGRVHVEGSAARDRLDIIPLERGEAGEPLRQRRDIDERLRSARPGVELEEPALACLEPVLAVEPARLAAEAEPAAATSATPAGRERDRPQRTAVLGQRLGAGGVERRRPGQPSDGEVLAGFQPRVEDVPGGQSVLRPRLEQGDGQVAQGLSGLHHQGAGGHHPGRLTRGDLQRHGLMPLEPPRRLL